MTNCDDLIEHLEAESKGHVALAVSASAVSVAEMHIDLAVFRMEQTQKAEADCPDVDEQTAAILQV